jgi:hypothetical protein
MSDYCSKLKLTKKRTALFAAAGRTFIAGFICAVWEKTILPDWKTHFRF